jgi:hypothetical protein
MRTFCTQATLVFSIPDEMKDQEAFLILNKNTNPYGVDFVFPLRPAFENPAILVRILRPEAPKT